MDVDFWTRHLRRWGVVRTAYALGMAALRRVLGFQLHVVDLRPLEPGFELDPESWEVKEIRAFPEGKRFVIVTSRGDIEDTQTHPEVYDHLQHWFELVTAGMRASSTDFINQYGSMNMKDAARSNDELMAKAEAIGASLV